MSHSMTGYGGAVKHYNGYAVQFELKSVNHRYSEVVLRMPKEWACYEDGLRRLVQSHIKRGRVDVYITKERDGGDAVPFVLNDSVVKAYLKSANELKSKYGIDSHLNAKDLLSLPDVLSVPDAFTEVYRSGDRWDELIHEGLEEAILELIAMRKREGQNLVIDMEQRLSRLEDIHAEMVQLAPDVVNDYRAKLKGRLVELLEGAVDEQRFAMEVAVFADRSNIDEELTRLKSHFEQCRGLLQSAEPVGRKLDFLIQEMNRETNTIGSKANHLTLVKYVVEMKAELEKIREQTANLE